MRKIKKILFLGNFRVDFTTESHHLETLKSLGYEVVTFQESEAKGSDILKEAENADLFIWTHTHGWETEGAEEMLQALKEKNIPTMSYHLDLWLGIERQKDLDIDPVWKVDYFFTVDKLMADFLNNTENMPNGFFVPAGVFEEECYIGKEKTEFLYDVIFVGTKNYHKEWPHRPRLIHFLEQTYGARFAHYGNDGIEKKQIRGERLNDLYHSAKIVIGDTLCKNFDYPDYFSDRIFETSGRGGFIIHPYIEGIDKMFELPKLLTLDGHLLDTAKTELITFPFEDFVYLKYVIDYYLKNEEEREAIRQRGFLRTKAEHTYTERLQYILNIIENEQ